MNWVGYLKASDNPAEKIHLLQADDSEVVARGLLALRGEQIDEQLLAQLTRLLQSPSGYVRDSAVNVISTAPWHPNGRKLAELLIASIATMDNIDDPARPVSFADEHWTQYTQLGLSYRRAIQALAQSEAIDRTHLIQLTPETPGMARDCVVIARGWSGDASIREDLYRIATEAEHPNIRGAALDAFGRIGAAEDLPFLGKVAKSDPFRIALSEHQRARLTVGLAALEMQAAGMQTPLPDHVHPNRLKANNLIGCIRSRAIAPK